jgi:hypothetical protein
VRSAWIKSGLIVDDRFRVFKGSLDAAHAAVHQIATSDDPVFIVRTAQNFAQPNAV